MSHEDGETISATEEPAAAQPVKKGSLPIWQESILLLATAVVLAIIIKALLVQAFYIPSESMEPGLVKNDRILVQNFAGSDAAVDVFSRLAGGK